MIDSIDPKKLVPWKANPRKIPASAVAAVARSIERFGFAAPVVVQAETLRVIAGHTRLKAALKLKLQSVPVRMMALSDAEADALALADNRLAEGTDWDEKGLRDVLAKMEDELKSIAGFGADVEAAADSAATEDEDDPADESNIDNADYVAVSEKGTVYDLGSHRLICGDSTDAADWRKLLGDERAEVIFTSPPYASQREYDASSGFVPIRPEKYVAWWDAIQSNAKKFLAPNGSFFVNIKEHSDDGQRHLYVKDLVIAHVRQWGWKFVDEFCWKRGGVPGKWPNRLKNAWEPVFHFAIGDACVRHENVSHESYDTIQYSRDNAKTHSGFVSGSAGGRLFGLALPSNVIDLHSSPSQIAKDEIKHTATYPVGLPEFFIKAFSDEGDIVVDPFLGSGTTLIAAAQTGRRCMGFEISPKYCDLIRRRWTRYAKENGIDPGAGALA